MAGMHEHGIGYEACGWVGDELRLFLRSVGDGRTGDATLRNEEAMLATGFLGWAEKKKGGRRDVTG
jgi:uncharacterized protein involved in copper resistance